MQEELFDNLTRSLSTSVISRRLILQLMVSFTVAGFTTWLNFGRSKAEYCVPVNGEGMCYVGTQKMSIPGRTPPVNGCGAHDSGWLGRLIPDFFGWAIFTEPCNNHDRCYANCDTPKSVCDNSLHNDMVEKCQSAYPIFPFSVLRRACYEIAADYYWAVSIWGDSPWVAAWTSAQRDYCQCCYLCEPPQHYCGVICCDECEDCINNSCVPKECGPCEVCVWGQCISLCSGDGYECCNGQCTDTNSDPNNCGSCGNTCNGCSYCDQGGCVSGCGPGLDCCGDICVDSSIYQCCNIQGYGWIACTQEEQCCGNGTCCAANEACCPSGDGGWACVPFPSEQCCGGRTCTVCPDGSICCLQNGVATGCCPISDPAWTLTCQNMCDNA